MFDFRKHFCIGVALVGLSLTVQAETKVFLMGGQSNMAGLGGYAGQYGGPLDQPCPVPYDLPQMAVQFWNYGPDPQPHPAYGINLPGVGTGWANLAPGYGHTPSMFGPEVAFGYRLHQLFPDDEIYLVKEGVTSQSLAVNWNPNGTAPPNDGGPGGIYNMFKARVNAALADLEARGKSPVIAGMVWMQGESDAMNHDWAVAYGENLTTLIDKVRSDFDTPNMPFVAGRITNHDEWGTPADNALVRNALMTVPPQLGFGSWVDTDDLPWATAGHYGTKGQIELGIRFADAIATMPEPSVLMLLVSGCFGWRCLNEFRRKK
ncbi:MAG: sialate O-acetylesterase [Phycisphaerae bacterium]|nr:sialate O-acetylesterase [Phycisphaerae bacterium]